jgi:LysR family hydrogen peroxide-inducible transcriptional activator
MPGSIPPFTLRQLRYLVALEETHHFREAAESCGISQPSLSVQIKTLEDALGQTLVERGRGPVRLTMAGREVARRGREMLDAAQGILDLSVTLKSGLAGTVRMGTSATLGPYLMPYVVRDLHKSHPDLRLYIREAAPRDLMRQLNEGAQDLILTQLPVAGAAFHVARLFREPLLVAMPADHPLSAKDNLDNEDLPVKLSCPCPRLIRCMIRSRRSARKPAPIFRANTRAHHSTRCARWRPWTWA